MKKSMTAPCLAVFPPFVRSSRIKLMAASLSFSWPAARFTILIRLSSIKAVACESDHLKPSTAPSRALAIRSVNGGRNQQPNRLRPVSQPST